MDKASAPGAGDSRLESWAVQMHYYFGLHFDIAAVPMVQRVECRTMQYGTDHLSRFLPFRASWRYARGTPLQTHYVTVQATMAEAALVPLHGSLA